METTQIYKVAVEASIHSSFHVVVRAPSSVTAIAYVQQLIDDNNKDLQSRAKEELENADGIQLQIISN